MKADNVKKMRRMLVKAINAHLKSGGMIATGHFAENNRLCPLSCLTGPKPPEGESYATLASEKLGFQLKDTDMWSFIDGIDGNTGLGTKTKNNAYKLGQSLRKKYAKELGLS